VFLIACLSAGAEKRRYLRLAGDSFLDATAIKGLLLRRIPAA
jgi:hypothetical protein